MIRSLSLNIVTDMLVAVLNTCTKEELEDSDEETTLASSISATAEESAERRKAIKTKIMAVGRMSRVFALLRSVNMFAVPFFPLTGHEQ